MARARAGNIVPCAWMASFRLRPSMYSMTMNGRPSSASSMSSTRTALGCWSLRVKTASFLNRAHAALADFAEDLVFAADQRPFGPHAGFFERRAVARAHGVIVGITGLARAAGLHSIRGSKKAAQAIS